MQLALGHGTDSRKGAHREGRQHGPLEFFKLDRNGERPHRPLSVCIEAAVKVAEAEGEERIYRLSGSEGCEVRFRDGAPQTARLIDRQAVDVVGNDADVHEAGRIAELPERGTGEERSAEALRPARTHDDARRCGSAPFLVLELIEESLNVPWSSQSAENSPFFRRPMHTCLEDDTNSLRASRA